MWAQLGGAIPAIAGPVGCQRLKQRSVGIPSTLVNESDRFTEKRFADSRKRGSNPLKISRSLSGQHFAARCQFALPCDEVRIRRVLFQRCIPLTQGLVIAAPIQQESLFHVEHAPVEEPAPTTRSFFQELVDLGVNDLSWKLLRQICDPGRRSAPDAPLGIAPRSADA